MYLKKKQKTKNTNPFFSIHFFTRIPPQYGVGLSRGIANLVPYAIMLHLCVSIWSYSNESVFSSPPETSEVGDWYYFQVLRTGMGWVLLEVLVHMDIVDKVVVVVVVVMVVAYMLDRLDGDT